jgi:glycosyltransferase involved in cell wall biosynthesis
MSNKPLVSVVINFLNGECFLSESIESVFAQTYDCWELLLVDDGSSDNSTAIAQKTAAQNPRQVYYLEHPGRQNLGKSAARNLGISQASGKYLAFLDADDVWLPEKLERQVPLLEAHPEAKMLYGNTKYWYSWTGKTEDYDRDFIPALGLQSERVHQPPKLLPFFLDGRGAVPCTCSILVESATVRRVGGFEESFRMMYEDQAFYAKICLAEPVYVSRECLDLYRQHPDSSSSVAYRTGEENLARSFYVSWLSSYVNQAGIKDKGVQKALLRARLRNRIPAFARIDRSIVRLSKRLIGSRGE